MKRVLVDNNKLTDEILDLLMEKFPDGYDYDDIVSFQNVKKKEVKAVEVRTEDTLYLVKISPELEDSMESYAISRDSAIDEEGIKKTVKKDDK